MYLFYHYVVTAEVPSPIPTQPLRLVFYKLIRRSKCLCVAARLIASYQSRIWIRVCGAAQWCKSKIVQRTI